MRGIHKKIKAIEATPSMMNISRQPQVAMSQPEMGPEIIADKGKLSKKIELARARSAGGNQ